LRACGGGAGGNVVADLGDAAGVVEGKAAVAGGGAVFGYANTHRISLNRAGQKNDIHSKCDDERPRSMIASKKRKTIL
jgi:hypothetical protein